MRFISLSPEEETLLTQLHATHRSAVGRRRSQCLLLSHKRHTIKQLTAIFSVTRLTITHWFDRWHELGKAGLTHTPGQGRKALLAEVSEPQLKELVGQHPQNLKAVLSDLDTQHAVKCSKDTLRRRLKNRALALQTSP